MALLGVSRRRSRRQDRRAKKQKKAIEGAYQQELARQQEIRRQEMARDVFQTTEGAGIMEGATVSLGFDEEEEDDLFRSSTGLII